MARSQRRSRQAPGAFAAEPATSVAPAPAKVSFDVNGAVREALWRRRVPRCARTDRRWRDGSPCQEEDGRGFRGAAEAAATGHATQTDTPKPSAGDGNIAAKARFDRVGFSFQWALKVDDPP